MSPTLSRTRQMRQLRHHGTRKQTHRVVTSRPTAIPPHEGRKVSWEILHSEDVSLNIGDVGRSGERGSTLSIMPSSL